MSKFNSDLGFEKIEEALEKKSSCVHFVGVGGVGMYSLFNLTRARGIMATGSDKKQSLFTKRLIERGEDVRVGEYLEALKKATLVVFTLAVAEDDPEILRATELGIPLCSRAEYLAYLSKGYKIKISVSGSHGKSTVSAMIYDVLNHSGQMVSAVSGAMLSSGSEPFKIGGRDYLVFEGCEYKDSFLKFSPTYSVFTNLELDHTDYFKTLDDIKSSFLSAIERAGVSFVNIDDENLKSLIPKAKSKIISYGTSKGAVYRAVNISHTGGYYSFSVERMGEAVAEIKLSVIGSFSVLNALGAFAVADYIGIEPGETAKILSSFSGIERRLQKIGERNGAPVIYDYAHHPSEIRAAYYAVREIYKGRINAVFKAHTYTRTKDLWDGFVESLMLFDRVFLSEVDGIRENEIKGINSQALANAIGNGAEALSDTEIISSLESVDGAVLIMGAAELEGIKNALYKMLDKSSMQ